MRLSIKKIIAEMPPDLSDLEKARYLYLKIGEIITYSFLFHRESDRSIRADIYADDLTIQDLERFPYEDKITLVCKQASELLAEALNEVDIQSRIDGLDFQTQNHVDVLATIDGHQYCFNLMKDAMFIQKHFRTRNFGRSETSQTGKKCDTIPNEEIERIDKKLGYTRFGLYMDDAVELLKKEMLDRDNMVEFMKSQGKKDFSKDSITKYKLSFIYQYLNNSDKKLELMEVRQYYYELFHNLFTKEERDKMSFLDYTDTRDYTTNSSITILELENETCFFMYNPEEGLFKPVTAEDVRRTIPHAKFAFKAPTQKLDSLNLENESNSGQEL